MKHIEKDQPLTHIEILEEIASLYDDPKAARDLLADECTLMLNQIPDCMLRNAANEAELEKDDGEESGSQYDIFNSLLLELLEEEITLNHKRLAAGTPRTTDLLKFSLRELVENMKLLFSTVGKAPRPRPITKKPEELSLDDLVSICEQTSRHLHSQSPTFENI